jgi:hypothetical protein
LRTRRWGERIGDQEHAAEDDAGERGNVTKSLCARSLLHFKRSRYLLLVALGIR